MMQVSIIPDGNKMSFAAYYSGCQILYQCLQESPAQVMENQIDKQQARPLHHVVWSYWTRGSL